MVKDDEVEIFGDECVDIVACEGFVFGEAFGKIGYRDPLVFAAERLDFIDSDFGDCRHRDVRRAVLAASAVLGGVKLVIKNWVSRASVH